MALLSKELGIDLGTLFSRVSEGGRIVLQEPTVAAIVVQEQKVVAWGRNTILSLRALSKNLHLFEKESGRRIPSSMS